MQPVMFHMQSEKISIDMKPVIFYQGLQDMLPMIFSRQSGITRYVAGDILYSEQQKILTADIIYN